MSRPYIQLVAGTSLCGKIGGPYLDFQTTKRGVQEIQHGKLIDAFGTDELWQYLYSLRGESDGVMVGANTVRKDNPRLLFQRSIHVKNPLRIVISSQGLLPLDSNVFDQTYACTIVVVVEDAPAEGLESLEKAGIEVIRCGRDSRIDFISLMGQLHTQYGIKRLLVEGGAELNWSLLSLGLIDEIRLMIVPVIIGGYHKSLVMGEGAWSIDSTISATYEKCEQFNSFICLTYRLVS